MRKIICWWLLLFFAGAVSVIHAQKMPSKGRITVIIVRHAEKDTSGGDDPGLTAAGMRRAERLPAIFTDVKPAAFYSTNYIRTRETLTPWAKLVSKEIQIYDPRNFPDLADTLRQQEGKTIVVAGHSNTVPVMVNLLIGEEKYTALADTEYSKIFVITIENGKAKEKVLTW